MRGSPSGAPFTVIFDCDGVLVDSEAICCRVLAEALTAIGLATTTGEVMAEYLGRSTESTLARVEERRGSPLPDTFAPALRRRTRDALSAELEPMPGVEGAVDRVRSRRDVCVASSGEMEKMELTLGRVGLLDRFRGRLYTATSVARGKPAPDLFLFAAARMGATADRCIVVEDSPLGVEAGVAAGMSVVGFARHTPRFALESRGARVIGAMDELPEAIEFLERQRSPG